MSKGMLVEFQCKGTANGKTTPELVTTSANLPKESKERPHTAEWAKFALLNQKDDFDGGFLKMQTLFL